MDILKQKRIVKAFYLFLVLFFSVTAKLIYVQIVQGNEYAKQAQKQQSVNIALEDIPRGDILDRNGKSLTGSGFQEKIIVFTGLIKKRKQTAIELAKILKVDENELESKLNRNGVLKYNLSLEEVRKIKEEGLPGILVMPVKYRYCNQTLAAHIVGNLGKISQEDIQSYDNDSKQNYKLSDWVGRTGLEKYYEKELKSEVSEYKVSVFADAAGNVISNGVIKAESSKVDQKRLDVVTTIDSRIQKVVEKIMDKHITHGSVVVMDVNNGDIVAMASRPNYNPAKMDNYLEKNDTDTFINHSTSLYMPGSVFKVVVAAAALEENVVSLNSQFFCLGSKDSLVSCWKKEGHGQLSFAEAFVQSCNPTFARVGLKLGSDKLVYYANKFGFANQNIIGYHYASDSRQNLELIKKPYSLVNSSIGQGPVLVTPLQVCAMMNTIVNDGVYMTPRLVRELRQSDGQVKERFAPGKSWRVISDKTDKEIKELLAQVVERGVGKEGQVNIYGSAGKTGSAEIDGSSQVNAWFAGFAPLKKPQYVVTVLVEGGESGGKTAAPIFKEIMEGILKDSTLTK